MTSAAHGRTNGDHIIIRGDNDYYGGYVVANSLTNTFEITATFVLGTAVNSTWSTGSLDGNDIFVETVGNAENRDSGISAEAILSSDETVVIASSGVPVVVGGAWSCNQGELQRVRCEASGRLTYFGREPKTVRIQFESSIEKSGGGSDSLRTCIAINGTVLADSCSPQVQNASAVYSSAQITLELNPGDFVEAMVENVTGTSDIIVSQNSKTFIIGVS